MSVYGDPEADRRKRTPQQRMRINTEEYKRAIVIDTLDLGAHKMEIAICDIHDFGGDDYWDPPMFGQVDFVRMRIILADRLSPERKLATLAHELGHFLSWLVGARTDEASAELYGAVLVPLIRGRVKLPSPGYVKRMKGAFSK